MWIRGSELGSENVWYERVIISFVGSILIKRYTKLFGYFISGYFITASKRSLGQGNVFAPVCQSFCSREGVMVYTPSLGRQPPRQTPPPSRHPLSRHSPCAEHPTSRHLLTLGRHLPTQAKHIPQPRWPLKRAAHILLECIHVIIEHC